MFDNVWLIPLFPLIGFLINGLFGKKIKNEAVIGGIGTLMIFLSFLVSCGILMQMIGLPPEQRVFEKVVFPWIHSGNFKADMAFLLDPLSCVMIMVVTGVGSLIHLYSIGYMHGEEGFYRFFAYLNLFCMSMLLLVLGSNMLVMFIGWEGVGLCSYLLIGYYFHKKSAGDAAKKAFVMNRVGDFGFLIGLFTLYWWFGSNHNIWTVNFVEIKAASHLLPYGGVVTIATLCFFVGATGKSAQIPLFTWLPDAMEGPTPVSALIHAATMVTAGVYMIGRMSFVFIKSPETMMVIAVSRCRNRDLCRHHRYGTKRYQASTCLFNRIPARFHVPGDGCRRIQCRYLPPDDPRLLQGLSVPRFRLGHTFNASCTAQNPFA